jgi:hypothetical protein
MRRLLVHWKGGKLDEKSIFHYLHCTYMLTTNCWYALIPRGYRWTLYGQFGTCYAEKHMSKIVTLLFRFVRDTTIISP